MKIKVNGEMKNLCPEPIPPTLEKVIAQLGEHPRLIVVEFNGVICSPQSWATQKVQDGDILEIVTIVGGGS